MTNNYELKHAAMPAAPDYFMIGVDLLDIGLNLIGKNVLDRERYINACADAAKLCFKIQDLKDSMMELYKQIEGMK